MHPPGLLGGPHTARTIDLLLATGLHAHGALFTRHFWSFRPVSGPVEVHGHGFLHLRPRRIRDVPTLILSLPLDAGRLSLKNLLIPGRIYQ